MARKRDSGRGGADRALRVRVKTARGRTNASARWLDRQLNDPYVARAKREGYRSRAAFKLIELDDRFGLIRPGHAVIDLGAAPGGWTQVAVQRAEAREGAGRVIGIDLVPVEPVAGADLAALDFLDEAAPAALVAMLGGRKADLVLSDMAASSTGHRKTDHLRIMALAEAAADFARAVLAPGGGFVAKVLRGGSEGELLRALKSDFAEVRHVKPPSSRADSAELFVVARGFRGGGAASDEG